MMMEEKTAEGGREGVRRRGEVGGHTVHFSDERKKEDICSLSKDKKNLSENVQLPSVCVCVNVCVCVGWCISVCLCYCLPVCLC